MVDIAKMSISLSFLLALVLTLLAVMGVNAADFWEIPASQAKCIKQYSDAYAAQNKEPVVIVVSQCPEVNVAKALADSAVNTGTTSVAVGDKVLILKKSELNCLKQLNLRADGNGMVRIAKDLKCD